MRFSGGDGAVCDDVSATTSPRALSSSSSSAMHGFGVAFGGGGCDGGRGGGGGSSGGWGDDTGSSNAAIAKCACARALPRSQRVVTATVPPAEPGVTRIDIIILTCSNTM